jgi:hypothetical protein
LFFWKKYNVFGSLKYRFYGFRNEIQCLQLKSRKQGEGRAEPYLEILAYKVLPDLGNEKPKKLKGKPG